MRTKRLADITAVEGIGTGSAKLFVDKIPVFIQFIKDSGLTGKLNESVKSKPVDKTSKLADKSIVMTGFRDKELTQQIIDIGGLIGSSISKKTFVLLVKSLDDDSGKVDKAKDYNIPIMTAEQFKKKYM